MIFGRISQLLFCSFAIKNISAGSEVVSQHTINPDTIVEKYPSKTLGDEKKKKQMEASIKETEAYINRCKYEEEKIEAIYERLLTQKKVIAESIRKYQVLIDKEQKNVNPYSQDAEKMQLNSLLSKKLKQSFGISVELRKVASMRAKIQENLEQLEKRLSSENKEYEDFKQRCLD
ncbi:hypothetical protein ENBRE01_2702 [Enteropsectra breve]|nr:hypothetical protein ENBRE01_2702 [Enteropsectra breve]